jgi:type VI secretion system lysozyme-like protein
MTQERSLQILTSTSYADMRHISSAMKKEQVILDLIKDISNLLNTKLSNTYIKEGDILEDFIINYGLPELSYYSPYSLEDQTIVGNLIKDCLLRFEPRLMDISVSLIPQTDNMTFHYKINGVIEFESNLCPLVIDSRISTVSQEILLTQESGVRYGL